MKLLINIGGTKTEALFWDGGDVTAPYVAATADFEDANGLISHFLASGPAVDGLLLAVAGPVSGKRARLTNGRLHFDETDLKHRFDLSECVLANDAVAGAWSLYDARNKTGGTHLFASVGTGLGGALLSQGAQSVVIPLEPGRLGTERILQIFGDILSPESLAAKSELEDVLSGTGLGHVARELSSHLPTDQAFDSARALFDAARLGNSVAISSVERFWKLLAAFCVDMTLFMPNLNSIRLSGSVVLQNLDSLETGPFLAHYKTLLKDHPDYAPLEIAALSANLAELRGLANLARVNARSDG